MLKTIEKRKNIFEFILKLCITVSVVVGILGIVFDLAHFVFVSFAIAWICFMAWIVAYQTGLLKRYRITGEISMDGNRIWNSRAEYFVRALDQIHLSYRGYKGLWIGRKYCYGDKNRIIMVQGASATNLDVLIESKVQLAQLQNYLEQWYSKNDNVKETGILGRSSVLLRTNLSYREKQNEMKRLLQREK